MEMKKILTGILAVAMLAASTAALAEEVVAISEETAVVDILPIYDKVILDGKVEKVEENQIYIVSGENETVVNTGDETVFLTADGNKTGLLEIAAGDTIRVIASEAMTLSLPPQSFGHVVIKYEEGDMLPIYAEIKDITTDDNGNTVAASKDGVYEVVIGPETELAPFATRQIIGLDAIREDARILVYSQIMTMSIPAVVPAEKVIVLPEVQEVAEEPERIIVNGKELDAKIINKDSVYMLPVRAISEALGLSVQWDGELKAISVGTIPMGATFNIGVNSYTKARMMPMTLASEPILDADRTYVPNDFFTEVLEAEVVIENGAIVINKTVNLD